MNLEKLRIDAGFTREALAKKVGCNKQLVYNWERVGAAIPGKYMTKYATAVKVRRQDLIDHSLKIRNAKFLKSVR